MKILLLTLTVRIRFLILWFNQGDITWNFFKEPGGEKYFYLNQYGKSDEIQNAAAVLKGYERAFSGRGYIWGRTIPLIAKHLLWGSGPDTFAAEFPQTDYVMKANTSLQYVPAASDQSPQYVSAVSIADRCDICYLSDNILAAVCDIFCEKISEEYKR